MSVTEPKYVKQGSIVGIKFDMDDGKLSFVINGTDYEKYGLYYQNDKFKTGSWQFGLSGWKFFKVSIMNP